jgi:prepilin-type N-terminal cleavage/methylation domain-containing protein/prepilin-type processing-associated H-X9-DG protein
MKKKGFTLIELLVVIAIIALLLAILMPSLKKAKAAAKRVVCLSHLHSLGLSWILYADDNNGYIVNGRTARITEISTSPRQFKMDWGPSLKNDEPTWVGWFVEPKDASGNFIADKEARTASIELGSLFPYSEATKVYRCPVAKKDEMRTYAIVDDMNGYAKHPGYEKVTKKVTQLRSTSNRLVFIDEGWASTGGWTIHPSEVRWWDRPPIRHGDGTTVSMADGSAEYWKYKDQRTVDYAKRLLTDPAAAALNNEDFLKIQKAAWGSK